MHVQHKLKQLEMPEASPQGKAHIVFRVYFKTSQGQFHEFLMQHCPNPTLKLKHVSLHRNHHLPQTHETSWPQTCGKVEY